jgi:hypothetical protein
MRKDGKKTKKDSRAKKLTVKDLTAKDAKAVKGGGMFVNTAPKEGTK